MGLPIRICLICAAILLVVFVVHSVRKDKMRIEDTLFWAFLSTLILILSIVPQIASGISEALGFQAPVNFVFLFFIAVLIAKCFSLSREVSNTQARMKELTQAIAIDRLDHHERTCQHDFGDET